MGRGDGKVKVREEKEYERDIKCNPIPRKRESLSVLKQKVMRRSALGTQRGSNGFKPAERPAGSQTL